MDSNNISVSGSVGGEFQKRVVEIQSFKAVKNKEINASHPKWSEVLSKIGKGSTVKVQTRKTGVRQGKISFIHQFSNGKMWVSLQNGEVYGEVIAVTEGPGIDGYTQEVLNAKTREEFDFDDEELQKQKLAQQQNQDIFQNNEKWRPEYATPQHQLSIKQSIRQDDLQVLNQIFQRFKSPDDIEQIYDLVDGDKEATENILLGARKQLRQMPRTQRKQCKYLIQSLIQQQQQQSHA